MCVFPVMSKAGMCPTQEQEWVYKRHNQDMKRMYAFIKEEWPTARTDEPVNMGSFVVAAMSTSLRSSVLLLSVGLKSMFTRNTYSHNGSHPWLIYQDGVQNEALGRYITEEWEKMVVPNGQRQRVNTIAKHIVYDFTDDKNPPEMKPLECDEGATVRVSVNDFKIWSHPRRNEPLDRVLKDTDGFKQDRGYFVTAYPRKIKKIRQNDQIEDKEQSIISETEKFKKKFDKFYIDYYCELEEHRIPTSYRFPTLQLELKTDVGQDSQRYGNTSSGCYSRNDNEVHHEFSVDEKLPEEPLPTKEMVLDELLECAKSQYEDVRKDYVFACSHILTFSMENPGIRVGK